MKKNLLAVVALLALNVNAQHFCGTDEYVQRKAASSPEMAKQLNEMYLKMEANRVAPKPASRAAKTVIYVPVVFHIIHNNKAYGVGENISDEQVQSQIDALNRDFALQAADTSTIPAEFKPLATNTYVQFCLAKFDPQGNPTNGIERIAFSKISWNNDNEIESQMKPSTIWDRKKYLNIWTCVMGGDFNSGGMVLAYATLPYYTTNSTDGVVARYNTVGTTGTLMGSQKGGRTIVHEVGHWLGLLHIWGNQAGCYDGTFNTTDFIDDTPDQYDKYFGCPSYPQYSCGTSNMFMNHMDYTDDNCRTMFTKDQADVMYNTINTGGSRSSFKNAISNCYYNIDGAMRAVLLPTDTICNLNFKPVIEVKNEGIVTINSATIYYKIDNGTFQSLPFNKTLGIQDKSYITLPLQTVTAGNHTLTVTFEKPNGGPLDDNPANDILTISFYAYDGGFALAAPILEDFELGNFPPDNWTIDNKGSANTWEGGQASAYNYGFYSAVINNMNYTSNPKGTRDALITDDYDVSQIGMPNLKFDMAYCRVNVNRYDSLAVYYSFDCGMQWNLIYKDGGTAIATAPDQTSFFIPEDTQWRSINLPLPATVGQNKVRFKFENISNWGNALYLDNINIYGTPLSSIKNASEKIEATVYPNPASDVAYISLPTVHPFSKLEVFNTMGQRVSSQNITQRVVELNTQAFPNGTYFIRLSGNNIVQHESLIISK